MEDFEEEDDYSADDYYGEDDYFDDDYFEEEEDDEFTSLLRRAHRGETAAVLAAVDKDRSLLNRADRGGWTVLHKSCIGGGGEANIMELVGALLERGADLHAQDLGGADACVRACTSGRTALVNMLLDKGASPHTRLRNGHTCITFAALFDFLSVVLLLISKGADLMERTEDNRTALEWWGEYMLNSPLSHAELAERRAVVFAAFRAGPHPREVQRRADERFAPRAAFMAVVVGCGFLPLEARRLALSLARASLGPAEAAADFLPVALDTAEKRRAYRLREILSNGDLVRRVASFL